jgi:hypothetical protein
VITSGTVINTDPSIITNGVTDLGKIYRGRSIDGPVSAWAFGSTSAFDTASGFDDLIGDNSGAAFKFTALQLNGDPTIDTTNGEINLGLIAVNGITSAGPGAELTFSGIRGLLLATQNGPITLGSEVSFSGLHDLTIYARGSSSDLTLGSDITTTSNVNLFAERDMSLTSSITTDNLYAFVGRNISISDSAMIHAPTINLFAGQNLSLNGLISVETASNSNGDVSISAGQTINVANDLTIVRQNGGITSGLNVSIHAGIDLLAGGNLSIATDISNLTNGANIDVLADRNLTVGGSLELLTLATAESGTGGNITLNVGHNLTTGSGGDTTLFVNNNTGHVINGARILGTIGGNVQTNNLTIALLNNGGEIDTGGNVSLEVSGSLTAQDAATFGIQNQGGTMGQNAPIQVAASNISANTLSALIDNSESGVISGDAKISMNVAGNANVTNELSALINNSEGGVINGDARISMNVVGTANVTNDATLAIYGSDGARNSAILVRGGNYNVGGTFLTYIDGNGAITFNNASAHADILKAGVFGTNGVLNIGGGTLSADTTLKLYAPGSNGELNFISNVTLDGNSKKILAANSVTIFDNVVVTIGGKGPADVYTNNPNYTGFGGNGSTTGTFAGAGANKPRPLSQAPPFDPVTPGNPTNGKRARTVINIKNSGQLLSLLDGAVPGRDGRFSVPRPNRRQAGNPDRLNVTRMTKPDRDMADIRRMRDRGVVNNRLGSGTRAF